MAELRHHFERSLSFAPLRVPAGWVPGLRPVGIMTGPSSVATALGNADPSQHPAQLLLSMGYPEGGFRLVPPVSQLQRPSGSLPRTSPAVALHPRKPAATSQHSTAPSSPPSNLMMPPPDLVA